MSRMTIISAALTAALWAGTAAAQCGSASSMCMAPASGAQAQQQTAPQGGSGGCGCCQRMAMMHRGQQGGMPGMNMPMPGMNMPGGQNMPMQQMPGMTPPPQEPPR